MKKHLRSAVLFLALVSLWLAGCQPEMKAADPVAPQVWQVQVSSALRPLGAIFNQCIQQLPGRTLLYAEQPLASLNPAKVDFTFSLQPPAGAAYTAVVGHTGLVVVVNPANPLTRLSLASVTGIYAGEIKSWADLAKTDCPDCTSLALKTIQPYVYAEGDDLQMSIHNLLPGASYRLANALLAPNPGAVRQAVAADPQAVGLIPALWLDSSVKALSLSDPPPDGLQLPLVVSAPAAPAGEKLSWLLCLQEAMSK